MTEIDKYIIELNNEAGHDCLECLPSLNDFLGCLLQFKNTDDSNTIADTKDNEIKEENEKVTENGKTTKLSSEKIDTLVNLMCLLANVLRLYKVALDVCTNPSLIEILKRIKVNYAWFLIKNDLFDKPSMSKSFLNVFSHGLDTIEKSFMIKDSLSKFLSKHKPLAINFELLNAQSRFVIASNLTYSYIFYNKLLRFEEALFDKKIYDFFYRNITEEIMPYYLVFYDVSETMMFDNEIAPLISRGFDYLNLYDKQLDLLDINIKCVEKIRHETLTEKDSKRISEGLYGVLSVITSNFMIDNYEFLEKF